MSEEEKEKQEHTFTCINCPMGCTLEAVSRDEELVEIEGNTCKAGEKYVESELKNPTRVLTSTVKVKNGVLPRVPVKSEEELPKEEVREAVKKLDDVELEAPVKIHQTVIENVLNSETNIITTRPLPKEVE